MRAGGGALGISDDINLVRGSHQWSFGFSSFKYQHSQFANVFSAGSFGFGRWRPGSIRERA